MLSPWATSCHKRGPATVRRGARWTKRLASPVLSSTAHRVAEFATRALPVRWPALSTAKSSPVLNSARQSGCSSVGRCTTCPRFGRCYEDGGSDGRCLDEFATCVWKPEAKSVKLEGARKECRSRRGSPPVGCSPCTAQVTNVEHHEEVSCTGRIALEDVRTV